MDHPDHDRVQNHVGRIVRILGVAAAYALAGRLGLLVHYPGTGIALIWLPAGIAVGALWRWGWSGALGVMLGVGVINWLDGSAWPLAVGLMIGNLAGPALTVVLLRRWEFHPRFDRRKDVGALVLAAAAGGAAAAGWGALVLWGNGVVPWEALGGVVLRWTLGDALGVVLVAPALFLCNREGLRAVAVRRVEAGLWLLGTAALAALAWLVPGDAGPRDLLLLLLPLVMVAWMALRFEVAGFALGALGVALVSAMGVVLGIGPFHREQALEVELATWWMHTATLLAVGWLITLNALERRRAFARLAEQEAALRRSQQALAASEERLDLAVRGANLGTWDSDLTTDRVSHNERYAEMLGRASGGFEARGSEWEQLLHPADRAPALARVADHFAGRTPFYESEHRLRRADGSWLWVLDRGRVMERDPEGTPRRVAGTILDISARKAAELAVRESNALFGAVVNGSADTIFIKDTAGRYQLVNTPICEALGRPETEILGRTDLELYPAALARRFVARDREIMASGRTETYENTDEWMLGVSRHFLTTKRPWRNAAGEIIGVIGISRDITEQKQAEERAHRLANFPELNPNPVLEFSAAGALTYHNPAALAMAQALGCADLRVLLPGNTAEIVAGCLAAGRARLRMETRRGAHVLSWSFYPITPHRVVHCYVGDVTERERLEAQLRQAQKMEAVGQLSGGVAHDFNNLLTAIMGHLGLLQDDSRLTPDMAESLEQIGKAAQRAAALTSQLLAFSRRQVFNPADLDLNALVADHVKMLRRVVHENIVLEVKLAAEPLVVHGDAGLIEQVLLNLAVNARDAMPAGGTLRITLAAVELATVTPAAAAAGAVAGKLARLSVADTGSGIPPEIRERIFEPFFTTKEVGKGTGLGLATVYGIVQQHGGWIEVESPPGAGATFQIHFPRTAAAPGPASARVEAGPTEAGRGETVLLVEDDPPVRELCVLALRRHGYVVLAAADAPQALELWRAHQGGVALLFTDLVMPGGMSGLELAARLQREQPRLPVIYSSGYSAEIAGRELTLNEGVNFLAKPYDLALMLQTVRAALGWRHSREPFDGAAEGGGGGGGAPGRRT